MFSEGGVGHACTVQSAIHGCGRRAKPSLQPIPVGASFERVGAHVLEMPQMLHGNTVNSG